ncbi:MAG: hypothetical protein IPL86_07155 [Flavobacteriales bacterium]|nr:hypothetical protein [Flavobacteriales bacterium]
MQKKTHIGADVVKVLATQFWLLARGACWKWIAAMAPRWRKAVSINKKHSSSTTAAPARRHPGAGGVNHIRQSDVDSTRRPASRVAGRAAGRTESWSVTKTGNRNL